MKYSPEMTKKICASIKALKGRVGATAEAGIKYDTFCEWMKKLEFSEAIKKAEEEAGLTGKERAIMSIFKAMSEHWQAAAWWLERNEPEKYALRTFVDTPKDGALARMLLVRAVVSPAIQNSNGNGNKKVNV